MRLGKAWILARKDFSEFRANRQILLTLTLLPVLMAVIMPVLLYVPILLLSSTGPPAPPDLDLQGLTPLAAANRTNEVLRDVWIDGGRITGSVLNHSRVENATLVGVVAERSFLANVTIEGGYLRGCVLSNATLAGDVVLVDTVVLEGDPQSATLRQVYSALALILPLFFFLIMAIAVPTTLAAYSFVGEKVNRSLEPLLAAPVTDGELLLGKYLAALAPTMAVLLISWAAFTAIADVLVVPALGVPPLPNATWLAGVLVLMPIFSFLGISVNVLISTKVNDVRVAQQYGALLVMPLFFFLILPTGGAFGLTVGIILGISAVVGVADLAVFAVTLRLFRREEILTRWT